MGFWSTTSPKSLVNRDRQTTNLPSEKVFQSHHCSGEYFQRLSLLVFEVVNGRADLKTISNKLRTSTYLKRHMWVMLGEYPKFVPAKNTFETTHLWPPLQRKKHDPPTSSIARWRTSRKTRAGVEMFGWGGLFYMWKHTLNWGKCEHDTNPNTAPLRRNPSNLPFASSVFPLDGAFFWRSFSPLWVDFWIKQKPAAVHDFPSLHIFWLIYTIHPLPKNKKPQLVSVPQNEMAQFLWLLLGKPCFF